jgi:sugar-specific transcriptional regulator TrmB
MKEYEVLSRFGLTKTEIEVYITLLKLGNATSGDIIHLTDMQNSVVHFTLKRLIAKGLVTFISQNRNKQYQAVSPKVFLSEILDQKMELENLLPELLRLRESNDKEPQVSIYSGKKGIKQLLYTLLEDEGKEHHTLGSSKKSLILGEVFWRNYHIRRVDKGIKAKLLFNNSLKSWAPEKKYKKAEIRYIPKEYEPITEHIVKKNSVAILLWTDPPIGILFRDKKAAKSYEDLFQLFWKMSEK